MMERKERREIDNGRERGGKGQVMKGTQYGRRFSKVTVRGSGGGGGGGGGGGNKAGARSSSRQKDLRRQPERGPETEVICSKQTQRSYLQNLPFPSAPQSPSPPCLPPNKQRNATLYPAVRQGEREIVKKARTKW
ncbi:hypothetical protein E2C01_072830 [Portunus trituberculatus]|uniref:Uncharacterized protein n=1 Tax=Portunus trituberculatus TaxID=210409 RepID=A0A5B7I8X5_PORTR|nr:hypothetical protein [Portunus trituberculatus]